jgi:pimeloyl-ACP methyl ester carboxylesterase
MRAPQTQYFRPQTTDKASQHQLAYYDWGNPDAEQVVVCVHGLTRNARDFDFLAEALVQNGARVITISMAGRGLSTRLENPMLYGYPTYVADCLALLDNFHLRHVDWVGTSMGGIIGMMIASTHPERVRHLVLNDIGSYLGKEALQRIYGYVRNLPQQFTSAAEADRYFRNALAPWGIDSDAQWQHFLRHSYRTAEDGICIPLCDPLIAESLRALSQDFTHIEDINLADIWSPIRIPCLILRGEYSDILDSLTLDAMKRTNPNAHTATVQGCGHAPALADRSQIALITQFLSRSSGTIRAVGI